jgi:predicted nucleotidyltransferase
MDHMDPDHDLPVDTEEVRRVLRDGGARFAFVHGSRASGTSQPGSDVDVAAWFGRHVPMHDLEVASRLPGRVDLLVLDTAPLELAGRVAMWGVLLYDDDPPARVEWQAMTRKLFLDERPRVQRMVRDYAAAARRG